MKIRHLLFDLDGTLIDSAPSILECYKLVLCQFSLEAKCPLEISLIGPPLVPTLRQISGVSDEGILVDMSIAFKKIYDTTGLTQSFAYVGIAEQLKKLHDNEHKLYVVTNKRMIAAKKILDFLGWDVWFEGVYAPDAFDPTLSSKSSVIERVLQIHSISKSDAMYFGDRNEDGEAAHSNGLKFVWVEWGYGDKASITNAPFDYEIVKSVAEIVIFVER